MFKKYEHVIVCGSSRISGFADPFRTIEYLILPGTQAVCHEFYVSRKLYFSMPFEEIMVRIVFLDNGIERSTWVAERFLLRDDFVNRITAYILLKKYIVNSFDFQPMLIAMSDDDSASRLAKRWLAKKWNLITE